MRFQVPFLVAGLMLCCQAAAWAQQAPAQPGQTAPQSAPLPPSAAQEAASTPKTAANAKPPSPADPYVIEDGGFYLEPIYWLNHAQPQLHGGATATSPGDYDYNGQANASIGGEIGFPAGPQNTLRISYFRVSGSANQTLAVPALIFTENYSPGDFVTANYRLQSAKVSWDYLSYNWHKRGGTLRLKTLYEFQWVNFSANFDAPLKAVTTSVSGTTDNNIANGSKSMFYPSFGLGLEQGLGRHFRWEASGSGFGIPHHGNLWDAQADIAIRVGPVEAIAGGKVFHVTTSPNGDEYFRDTLSGAFVGLRYYWGGSHSTR